MGRQVHAARSARAALPPHPAGFTFPSTRTLSTMEPHASRLVRPPAPIDLRLTLGLLRHGAHDPTIRLARDGSVWRATRTPDGPATERLVPEAGAIRVDAWGPGAAWLVEHAPELVGATDDPGPFEPVHPLLRELLRRFAGLRIPRSRAVFEALVPAICEQKVTGTEAAGAIAGLLRRYGEPAPGPWDGGSGASSRSVRPGGRSPLRVPPAAATLAGVPSYDLHALGLERRRADTIRRAAARADRLEECVDLPFDAARARLMSLPGVGAWTAAEVAVRALGDPDAVSVGDAHLARTIAWALAREARADDARMLELLEPYRGQRARAIRLIEAAGIRPPRFGPRLAPRSIVGT